MNTRLIGAALMMASLPALSGQAPEKVPAVTDLNTIPLVKLKDVPLNKKEWEAAKKAANWINREDYPKEDENGKLVFLYGQSMPTIICAPLRLCDIELQPGEMLKETFVSDKVRWKVAAAVAGADPKITHVIVKPTMVGLEGTLVVLTDRRSYHLKLKSRKRNFMPYVAFEYEEDLRKQWEELYAKRERERALKVMPETGESIANLDFEYEIDGDVTWRPVRVYNNGVKTIIQMPKAMSQTEAPALLVMSPDGKEQVVNYRLHKDRYIVDYLFDEAMLIAGVGGKQSKVLIRRKGS